MIRLFHVRLRLLRLLRFGFLFRFRMIPQLLRILDRRLLRRPPFFHGRKPFRQTLTPGGLHLQNLIVFFQNGFHRFAHDPGKGHIVDIALRLAGIPVHDNLRPLRRGRFLRRRGRHFGRDALFHRCGYLLLRRGCLLLRCVHLLRRRLHFLCRFFRFPLLGRLRPTPAKFSQNGAQRICLALHDFHILQKAGRIQCAMQFVAAVFTHTLTFRSCAGAPPRTAK